MNGNDRVVVGYYSYPSPDGQVYTVNYISDRNGYRATGTQLGPGGSVTPIPSISSSTLSPFPTLGSNISPGSQVIPLQQLQPGYVSTTPSPFIIPPAPYTPTQSPYSPTQSIYTPSSTYAPSTTQYPYYSSSTPASYVPSSSYVPSTTQYPYYSSSTPTPYVPSSTFGPSSSLPPFPVYGGTTVPFPGYVYSPQGQSFSPYNSNYNNYNYPSGPGYSTPVTRFNFGTTPTPYTRSTSAYTTPLPNVVLPSSTPSPFVRSYQPAYGLANNNNAPAILASTPRPFVATATTPSPYSNDQDIVYITPSPKLYVNPSVQPLNSNAIDSNYYRNNYGFQSVRPLITSTPLPPTAGGSTITNFAYRNGNAYW